MFLADRERLWPGLLQWFLTERLKDQRTVLSAGAGESEPGEGPGSQGSPPPGRGLFRGDATPTWQSYVI